jgi:hypothetical protein
MQFVRAKEKAACAADRLLSIVRPDAAFGRRAVDGGCTGRLRRSLNNNEETPPGVRTNGATSRDLPSL